MYQFTDKDLGLVVALPHKRAKSVIARRKAGHVQLTIPVGFSLENTRAALNSMKPKLLTIKPPATKIFTETDILKTFTFHAAIQRATWTADLQLTLKEGKLTLWVPSRINVAEPRLQQIFRENVQAVMRVEAKRVIKQKVAYFAQKHHLTFNEVKINKSKTRWGSCSGKKNLNFSLFTMLLPERFIDYIVLHELAHTKEMNHSPAFWELLSLLCGEDAKQLSREVKNYHHEWYNFLTG